MTTIAFDGRFLAADRRMCFGTEINRLPTTKLRLAHGFVYASTGYIHGELMDAMIDADDITRFYGWRTEPGNLIRIDADGKVKVWSDGDRWGHHERAPCAWGTGSDYATGAMMAGADAMRAVEIVSKVDNRTGDGVQFVDLENLGSEVQDWPLIYQGSRIPDGVKPGECVWIDGEPNGLRSRWPGYPTGD